MKKTKTKKVKKKYISRKEFTCYIGWMQGFISSHDRNCDAMDVFQEILKVMKYEKPKN